MDSMTPSQPSWPKLALLQRSCQLVTGLTELVGVRSRPHGSGEYVGPANSDILSSNHLPLARSLADRGWGDPRPLTVAGEAIFVSQAICLLCPPATHQQLDSVSPRTGLPGEYKDSWEGPFSVSLL